MDEYEIKRPTGEEQRIALESYSALSVSLDRSLSEFPEIEILETEEKFKIPIQVLKQLAQILWEIGHGNPVSIAPVATEITTQAAADLLGCSRPHVVKLLENGEIPYRKVGKHRRIKYEDLSSYKKAMKSSQKKGIQEIMRLDEESDLYDT